jgi:hypothetical protein
LILLFRSCYFVLEFYLEVVKKPVIAWPSE